MNQNMNEASPQVCGSGLDDFDFSLPLDLPLLDDLRVDDRHMGDAYVNTISRLSVDHEVQLCKGNCTHDSEYSADVLKNINDVLLDEAEGDKACLYGTSADINSSSCKLNFDTQAQSSSNNYTHNIDYSNYVFNYMRNFLLEDDVEEKTGISGNHQDANLSSCKLSSVDSPMIPRGDEDMNHDIMKYMYPAPLDDNVQQKAPTAFDVNLGSSHLISEEDLDFGDDVLKYINHILLEEGVEEKTCTIQESEALQATEQSLYEAMWGQYPTSASHNSPYNSNLHGYDEHHKGSTDFSTRHFSQSYYHSSSSNGAAIDGAGESPSSSFELVDIHSGKKAVMQKNVKEGEFLLDGNFLVCLSDSEEFPNDSQQFSNTSTGKKHPQPEDPELLEGRSSKQFAVYSESSISEDVFDEVLVFRKEKEDSTIREEINKAIKATLHHDQSRGSKGGKRGKNKKAAKKNEVDLRTLLTLCAQAVAAEDQRSVTEFLRQIRQHSTPTGDGMQRLAHYFADGLEARMAGAGTQVYNTLINMPILATDILKAYHIFLATCPHRKTSNFFSNRTVLNIAENASCLHIVDFGTLYGFQWPSFLHKLSSRPGGPPRVRFTAIDFPCLGFRPSQRIQETGRRLTSYAKKFNVPFEFNGIAQKWETIKLEDIKIKRGEVLVANCLYRVRYLLDETVLPNCPRDIVLNLIRKMNPAVFVLGIRNGGYNGPFFLTRFREALFDYSSIFDVLDATISRDMHERMLLERVVLGREAMNAIACEGAERIERPETYKQWQVRLGRAGLEALPLNRDIMATARSKVKLYHKDFVIDDDGYWLLQGWKGRICYALSCWRPAK